MTDSRRKLLWGAALAIAVAVWWWHPWSRITIREKINPLDGAVMVWVPAGTFNMGTSDGDLLLWSRQHGWWALGEMWLAVLTRRLDRYASERPAHPVFLDGYWLYKDEVTVAQYRRFCRATGHAMPEKPEWGWRDTHPIVNVTWVDAAAYAKWAGAALPTEAQWEKAARGTDGRLYPWGDAWEAGKCANWANSDGQQGHPRGVHPVGSFPAGASPYGARDLAGNVWEWCADWHDAGYYRHAPRRNPTGPPTGTVRVLRGGGWYYSYLDDFRCACRGSYYPTDYDNDIGFRCASLSPGP